MSVRRPASKLLRAAARQAADSTSPPSTRHSMVQIAAVAIRRAASELSRMPEGLFGFGGRVEAVTQAAHGLDQIGVQLLAQAADKDFDRVGVAVEILVIEMLDQFGARHHLAAMMGEIGQQAVFL